MDMQEKKREAPTPIRFYRVVRDALNQKMKEVGIENVSYIVNHLVGTALGIPGNVIAQHRQKQNDGKDL